MQAVQDRAMGAAASLTVKYLQPCDVLPLVLCLALCHCTHTENKLPRCCTTDSNASCARKRIGSCNKLHSQVVCCRPCKIFEPMLLSEPECIHQTRHLQVLCGKLTRPGCIATLHLALVCCIPKSPVLDHFDPSGSGTEGIQCNDLRVPQMCLR